jgi:hypothetical protein
MNPFRLLLFFFFISLTCGFKYTWDADGDGFEVGDPTQPVHSIPKPLIINKQLKSTVNVTVTAKTSVLICIQEQFQLIGGITSCNPAGFLNFTITNQTTTTSAIWNDNDNDDQSSSTQFLSRFSSFSDWPDQTVWQEATLRLESVYYISFQFIWYGPNSVNTSGLSLTINGDECPSNNWGPECSKNPATPLTPNTNQTVTVKPNSINYYSVQSTANALYASLKLTVAPTKQTNNTLPIGLYYRRNGFPLINRKTKLPGDWDLGVYNWDSGVNNSSAELVIDNPPSTSGNTVSYFIFALWNNQTEDFQFVIQASLKTCQTERLGPNCSSVITALDLSSYKSLTANVIPSNLTQSTAGSFSYFYFNTSSITIGVGSYEEGQTPNVYLALNNVPSQMSNLLANENQTEEAHLFQVMMPPSQRNLQNFNWYLAVNSSSDYILWVQYPCARNCSSHGQCRSSGICLCNDPYEAFDCSSKSFPLIWIIIIAVGGAIVLALAIAIPLMCFIRNKRRGEYHQI